MTFQAKTEAEGAAPRLSLPMLMRDVAVVLIAGALCLVLASNLSDLTRAKTQLNQLISRQETTLKTTDKAEGQLDALARGIQQLAVSGNPNAQKIVAVLQANGVHIKP
jgi:hypothetical protein